MRIAILSRGRTLYSTRRLAEAGRKRNHDVRVLDPHRCVFGIDNDRIHLEHEGLPLADYDIVIPRVGSTSISHTLGLIRHFELNEIPCLNSSIAIESVKDKLRAQQVLARAGIPVPRTITTRDPNSVDSIVRQLGGPPVVLKVPQGTQGVGVIVAESIISARSVVETLWSLDKDVIIQEFIEEARGVDTRVLVVGTRVIGAMRRKAADDDFRSNLHRGGVAEYVDIPDELAEIAVEATLALGLDVAGIDVLKSSRGPLVLEANASPGLQGIEAATGIDIAKAIIRHAEELTE